MARLILAFLLSLCAVALAVGPTLGEAKSFVAVDGHRLVADGQPFYFTGANVAWATSPEISSPGKIDAIFGAAQSLGMRVVRVWPLSPRSPAGDDDLSLLDHAVASAASHDLRLIVTLGNTWKAFGAGPEKWLDNPAGKTVADFYADEGARGRYKAHIARVAGRYRDDATVMAYDLINEPRCPGCNSSQQAARDSWIDEMVAAVRSEAPNQLVLTGSEGFFGPGSSHVSQNPGAGSACEGDDFETDAAKASAATVRSYWRVVEATPSSSPPHEWKKPGFDDYVPYLAARLDLLEQMAAGMGKPLIVEEFGLTARFFDQDQVKAAVAVVLDRLVRSKQQGGALAGALIWQLAEPGMDNAAGYNFVPDGGAGASNVGLGSAGVFGGGGGGGAGGGAAGGGSNGSSASMGGRRRFYHRRHLQEDITAEDTLDAFRRGPQRAACANGRAPGWTFPYGFARSSGVSAEAVRGAVQGASLSSLFKEAAEKL